MSMRGRWLAAVLVAMTCSAVRAELAVPTVPVVLTVIGDVAHSNRGPMDPTADRLMGYHEREFETGAGFDLSMLEALGMETRKFKIGSMPVEQVLEDPTIAAVLRAVGADPSMIRAIALDGFQVEVDAAALQAKDWLVGIKRNGDYLGIGDFGPGWLVFSPAAEDGGARKEEAQTWPYRVFLIEVDAE